MTLFARYAKYLVQAAHSPLENDWMIGKSIIWSVISIGRFTWIRSLNCGARNLEGCRGYTVKTMQVLRHEHVPLKHYSFPRTLKTVRGNIGWETAHRWSPVLTGTVVGQRALIRHCRFECDYVVCRWFVAKWLTWTAWLVMETVLCTWLLASATSIWLNCWCQQRASMWMRQMQSLVEQRRCIWLLCMASRFSAHLHSFKLSMYHVTLLVCLPSTSHPQARMLSKLLSDELRRVADIGSRPRVSSTSTLIVPSMRVSTLCDQTFAVAASRIWSSLPLCVTSAQSSDVNPFIPGF